MHANKVKSIKSKLRKIIDYCEVDQLVGIKIQLNGMNLFYELVADIKKEKSLMSLSKSDIFSIFYKYLLEVKQDIELPATAKPLNEIIDKEKWNIQIEKIVDFLSSIPRNYTILFDIPLFYGRQKVEFENISFDICSDTNSQNNSIGYLNHLLSKKTEERSGLKLSTSGYCDNATSETFKQALSILKVIIQQGKYKKLFVKNKNHQGGLLSSYLAQKNIPSFQAQIVDLINEQTYRIPLSDETCCFLERLIVNLDSEILLGNSMSQFLKRCYLLTTSSNKGIKSIVSAIEWCFDSYTYEDRNDSMAFLQICFGLEALFTENEENSSITNTLAIKCSYLISTTAEDRKINSDKIKEIYRVRSKLVHGVQNALTGDEIELLHYGRVMLEYAIAKEMKMYKELF